ncbi:MAG: hypothetical protein HGA39_09135 [Coriobacteriia bacterium]|nr:hypothetical protein [Coriobacteriia bacterium]
MHYETIFDYTRAAPSWMPLLWLVGFVAFMFGIIFLKRRFAIFPISSRQARGLRGLVLGFVTFCLAFVVLGMVGQRVYLSKAIGEGRTQIAEGTVDDYASHKDGYERFTVQGVLFEYSDDGLTAGFNHTQSRGGPIRGGLQVRVTYVDGDSVAQNSIGRSIVKLEIAR